MQLLVNKRGTYKFYFKTAAEKQIFACMCLYKKVLNKLI